MGRWESVSVDGSDMRCYVATPRAGNGTGAGVLVCMHGPGIDAFIQEICERLALSGFTAVAPDFYHRQPEPRSEAWTKIRDPEALRDMAAGLRLLKGCPQVDPERTGVLGFCMGGRLAFLQAASCPALRAAVVFHGGNILVARDGLPSPLERARDLRVPVLGLFGAEDTNPSPSDVQRIAEALTQWGTPHEFHTYPHAGHAFLNFTRPAVFREAQARDAWDKCLSWLKHHL